MVEIKKYWTTADGEPELGEFADYVRGMIKSHSEAYALAAVGAERNKVEDACRTALEQHDPLLAVLQMLNPNASYKDLSNTASAVEYLTNNKTPDKEER